MRHIAVLLCLALLLLAMPAGAQSCTPQSAGIPALTGRLVYEDFGGPLAGDTGAIYYYDFLNADTCTMPALIPTSAAGLTAPTNPIFSPDGQAIVFSAVTTVVVSGVATQERHIFYWQNGAVLPVNLTLSLGNQRFEDVKFSPDGHTIIWKQAGNAPGTGGIYSASFSLDGSGQPQIGTPQQLVPGTISTATEASGPVYSPDGNHIYYFTGSAAFPPQQIMRYDVATHTSGLAFTPQSASNYYYYPVVDNATGRFFYTSGAVGGRDQIFDYPNANAIGPSSVASALSPFPTSDDLSDPTPVDSDHIILSIDNFVHDDNYALFLGQVSTGQVTDLSALNINVPNTSLRGATYTTTRPTTGNVSLTIITRGTPATVTSQPTGTACSSGCTASFPPWTSVTLTAIAPTGYVFTGWGDAGSGCSGTGSCTVVMSASIVVQASFAPVSGAQASYALTVLRNGGGLVTSTPVGIDCGSACSAGFTAGTNVSLTTSPMGGFHFAGWSGACSGAGTCIVPMNTAQSVTANFSSTQALPSVFEAAVLPASRAALTGSTVSAFATIINTGSSAASNCAIAPIGALPINFAYQTTNPATNALTGTPNTPVNIGPNASQSFVFYVTPTAGFAPTALQLSFACANLVQAPIVSGLNQLLISASSTPIPDMVALVATTQNDGIVHTAGASGSGAFAVATVNLGAAAAITVSANTGSSTLPLTITVCQTNPTSGQCMTPPGGSVTTTVAANADPTFGIFVTATGSIPLNPAESRITVQFADGTGAVRGETTVAVETQ